MRCILLLSLLLLALKGHAEYISEETFSAICSSENADQLVSGWGIHPFFAIFSSINDLSSDPVKIDSCLRSNEVKEFSVTNKGNHCEFKERLTPFDDIVKFVFPNVIIASLKELKWTSL